MVASKGTSHERSRPVPEAKAAVEMYLTIPREVTGRMSEPVRCSDRVVHADPAGGCSRNVGRKRRGGSIRTGIHGTRLGN
jgi:hypothetical protein